MKHPNVTQGFGSKWSLLLNMQFPYKTHKTPQPTNQPTNQPTTQPTRGETPSLLQNA